MNFVFQFILIAVIITFVSCYTHGHNGRPKCETQAELNQINWRNNFDPTKFWRCTQKSIPAEQMQCPVNMGYDSKLGKCVYWQQWRWTSPIDPPTMYWE